MSALSTAAQVAAVPTKPSKTPAWVNRLQHDDVFNFGAGVV